jgi:hypothetical protein
MGPTLAARTALAAVLTAALLSGGAVHDDEDVRGEGTVSVAHAAVAASSPAAEQQVLRAPAVAHDSVEPACARPLPALVAPDVQSLRVDVVTCPSQGPPRAGC